MAVENPSTPVKLTYRDIRRLPDDGMRHELIDGIHYVSPAPRLVHQRVSGRVHLRIATFLEEHPIGRVYYAPVDVVLSKFDCVEPDLLYISREREERLSDSRLLKGAPELVIEILSPSTQGVDEGPKLRLYERAGVAEYWLMGTQPENVRIYRLINGRLQLCEELSRREGTSVPSISTPLLPGLEIPLNKIFD